jgi:lysyl-tRNA synthetase class 2
MNQEPLKIDISAGGIDDVIAQKTAKVLDLKSRGIDPYPALCARTHSCLEAFELARALSAGEHGTQSVSCAGRIVSLRDMGKSIFANIQDISSKIQVYFKKDAMEESNFELIKKDIHTGDFISVSGLVFKTRTGEPTIAARELSLLAKSLRSLPEKWHGLKDVELRYRYRHLDLIASEDVRRVFLLRSRIISTIRKTLDAMGFIEVETPVLLSQAGGAAARPFKTRHNALEHDMVLRIATELYLKRLIIGGFDKVYEMGRVFRNEGIDTRHNPEFTMIEVYEAYSDYHGMARLFERLVSDCAEATGIHEVVFAGKNISLKSPFAKIYLPEAWEKFCGEKIERILDGKKFNLPAIRDLAQRLGVPAGDNVPSAKIFDRIMDSHILNHCEGLTFVFDYPTAITPLAKLKTGTESLVQRFECFAAGQEISNAYSELNDPLEQRERLKEQARQRMDEGNDEAEILDEDFVEAMETGMPPTGGIGIGIDRLVMLFTGQSSIHDVIFFPTLKPKSFPPDSSPSGSKE